MGKGPTLHSVSGALVGCAQLRDVKLGAQVHGLCLKSRFEMDVVVGTSLIDMYIKSSDVEASRGVFDGVIGKNVVTWTSMVNGYSLAQRPDEAMVLVRNMSRLGIRANFLTYNCLLSSFSFPVDFDHFKQVHCCVIREGLESNHYLLVSLMTMYSRSSNAEDFLKICSTVRIWDQISWNGVIAGFANLQKGEEALVCYNNMRHQGINVDVFTLVSILKAMGIIAALDEGRQTHGLVFKIGYASNLCVQNGLVSILDDHEDEEKNSEYLRSLSLRWQEVQRDRKAVKQHEGGMISNKRMADLVTKKLAPSYGAASDATI
ncbi:hypothetical protein ACET3Z_005943 [Daucus carota]